MGHCSCPSPKWDHNSIFPFVLDLFHFKAHPFVGVLECPPFLRLMNSPLAVNTTFCLSAHLSVDACCPSLLVTVNEAAVNRGAHKLLGRRPQFFGVSVPRSGTPGSRGNFTFDSRRTRHSCFLSGCMRLATAVIPETENEVSRGRKC